MPVRTAETAPRTVVPDRDDTPWLGRWGALLAIWALTTVPAGFSVYIIRTALSERWPAALQVVETPLGTLIVWLGLTIGFTAWGLSGGRRR